MMDSGNRGNGLWQALEDGYRWHEKRCRVMTTRELMAKGLYFGPQDRVNMEAFKLLHGVETPDGRRFLSEKCALAGLEPQQARLALAFWGPTSAKVS